ncbi:MAG: SPFH domain-containing protein, partial [Clostridia bacterium]|nr:SPFH domain-containing protein [Clostridia bacterium]
MQEKILTNKKNGFIALILTLLLVVASIAVVVTGGIIMDNGGQEDGNPVIFLLGLLLVGTCWIPFLGLKVLKPQEALVLTLFGKYVGTLKGDGFYFVNPFCVAFNPAAQTKHKKSGDVNSANSVSAIAVNSEGNVNLQLARKDISIKIMTLNNNKQKINDCLGNPVEIGIAVMWKVVDTAKAVFNVDNYKEYLSLQCDSALRNVVRVYPY